MSCGSCGGRSEVTSTDDFLNQVRAEAIRARKLYGSFHSSHEAYAVMAEELDEFFQYVKKTHSRTVPSGARKELVQLAAMALCTYVEVVE